MDPAERKSSRWLAGWPVIGLFLLTAGAVVALLPLGPCPTVEALRREMSQAHADREYLSSHPDALRDMHRQLNCKKCTWGRVTLLDRWRNSVNESQR